MPTFLLCLLLSIGCSSSSSQDSAPPGNPYGLPSAATSFQPPSQAISDTPWGQELANVGADGTRSKQSALRLFAIAFGAIPEQDAIDNGEPIRSATAAIRAVQAHWQELTPAQQSAIQERLTPSPDAVVIRIDPVATQSAQSSSSLRPLAIPGQAELDASIRAAAIGLRAQIAAKLGADTPGPIDVIVTGVDPAKFGEADFDYDGPGATYSAGHVWITEMAVAGGAPWILDTLAHELFHCFEASGYRTQAGWAGGPPWVIEGGAEWVGNDLVGVIAPIDLFWDSYLKAPSVSLQSRSYDALGFWAHLLESGINPWTIFPAVFKTAGGTDAFVATSAPASAAFLDSWASCTTRDPGRGPGWDTDGPGITSSSAPVKGQKIANGDSWEFAIKPYTLGLYALFVSADVLTVAASGHARISDGKIDTTAFPTSFCLKQGGCDPCPNASGTKVPPAPLRSDPVLAVTGGASGTMGTLSGMTLDDFCKKDDSKPVWVHLERPASKGVMAGNVVELAACGGKIGPWSGVLRVGGIDAGGGFVVPFTELPTSFTITAEGVPAEAKTSGTVKTPVYDVQVAYDLQITVNGDAMAITGTGSADNGMFALNDVLIGMKTLPIEPAPVDKCP